MLIGNRWVENTRLKILNTDAVIGAAWQTFPGHIVTNLSERGFLWSLTHTGQTALGTSLQEWQILFDGHPPHQGFFRSDIDNSVARTNSQQPTTMPMPPLDVPPNTEVTIRGRRVAGAVNWVSMTNLYIIVYYMKDWDAALPAVCFPTDVARPDSI